MIKRTLLGVVVLGTLAMFIFGRDALSYVGTGAGLVQESVKDSVPVQFEIDRARKMVRDLVPDIRKNMHVIAKEEVEVERLSKQITQTESKLAKDRTELMRLKDDLAGGGSAFHYAGRSYSADQVKVDLANRFARFKTADATLGSLRDIHEARERSLTSARQKLEAMLAAKRQLEVDVENLEARLKAVEVAQTASDVNLDDSQLSRTKELVTDLRTRLDVAEKLVNSDQFYQGEIPLDQPNAEDIVEQLTEYFEPSATKVAAAEKVDVR